MKKEMMLTLMDKVIKVDRGGPESRIGKLLAVEDDYFTILTEEDGIVYYKMQHIKSLTMDTKSGLKFDMEVPTDLVFLKEGDFKSVVGKLRHEWIKVNRGGPEMLEGVLDQVDVNDDFVTIHSDGEVIRLAMFHIRNISVGPKVENKENTEENEGNNKENQTNNKENQGNNKQRRNSSKK